MTDLEKKGLEYLNKKINDGNTIVTLIIGELVSENETLKDLLNRSNVRLAEEQIKNEELKNGSLVKELTERVKQQTELIEWINEELKHAQKNFHSHNLSLGQAVTVMQDITASISQFKKELSDGN